MNFALPKLKGDKVIWLVVLLLVFGSILAVYSSTSTLAYRWKQGNTEYYLLKHASILIMGLVLMYTAHSIKYVYYARLSVIILFIAVPLLLYTMLFGAEVNNASRWATLPGTDITFQPSDLAKLALIIFIAKMLTKKQDYIKDFKKGFLPIVIAIIAVCGLIFPENFSTSALLFATCFILMFIGGIKLKYLALLAGGGVFIAGLGIVVLSMLPHDNSRVGTWQNRIASFTGKGGDTQDVFQAEQSKIAIAAGGIVGKGPGDSLQKNFLPNPFNDFIFSIIIEEYGIVGGIAVILLYLILMYRGIRIAMKCSGVFGKLLVLGLTIGLVFQAMAHMAVCVGLAPVTGQPLPMISMGGTSIWFTSISIGIILSVSASLNMENEKSEIVDLKNKNLQEIEVES